MMGLVWKMLDRRFSPEMLGYIPMFLSANDPRPAREQFDKNYVHGGWQPFHGFTMRADGALCYPGDPPLPPLAETTLRDETIRFHDCAWVVILQADGSWEVARLD